MENPEYVTAVPLILLAIAGLAIAFMLFAIPAEDAGAPARTRHAAAHPDPNQYVVIGIVLAVLTAVEVALYYVDMAHKALVVLLIVLSVAKFGFVIGWFMHLRFDSKLFTVLFLGGLALAIAVFTVAVATLDAGLV
jgi:cytochrome c oxidase subunit 4